MRRLLRKIKSVLIRLKSKIRRPRPYFGFRKHWRKYVVGLLILTFVAGPIGLLAQDALHSKYDERFRHGTGVGFINGYAYGKEVGYNKGFNEGFDEGVTGGYISGVTAMDNPHHKAALEFEQRNPYADVLDGGKFNVNDEPSVGYIIFVPTRMSATEVEVLMIEIMRLAEQVYDGETYFILYLAWVDPMYYVEVVQGWAFPYEAFIEKGMNVTREEGLLFMLPFPVELPKTWHKWPGHPYTEATVE